MGEIEDKQKGDILKPNSNNDRVKYKQLKYSIKRKKY